MTKVLFTALALAFTIASHAQSTDASLIGSEISSTEALQWTDNYKKIYGNEQRICFGREIVNKFLLASGVESVYIFKGLDEFDQEVLILRAANKQGELISNSISIYSNRKEVRKNLSSAGAAIKEELADQMITKFQTTFKNRVPIYLFGKRGFDTILQQAGAKGIYFANGLDQKEQEHLIFIGADQNGMLMTDGLIWNHGSGIFSVLKKFLAQK